jgi:hypothetical protein
MSKRENPEFHEPEELNSLDDALQTCGHSIGWHRGRALIFLVFILPFIASGFYGGYAVTKYGLALQDEGKKITSGNLDTIGKSVERLGYATLVASVALAWMSFGLYRRHMDQAIQQEHFQLGLRRIRVAARNSGPGFQTEVRQALTEGAFAIESKSLFKRKIESPVPGHPPTDVTTQLLNRLLDNFDIKPKNQ